MSYNQERTTESWNNDPNKFSNTGGPKGGYEREHAYDNDANFQQQRRGDDGFDNQPWNNQQQQFGADTRPTRDPTDTSTWGPEATGRPRQEGQRERSDYGQDTGAQPRGYGDNLWSAGPGENYGNTGIAGNTTDVNVPGAGPGQGGFREGDNRQRGPQSGQKPSVGQKLKGNVEKMTDRITGHQQ